MTWQNNIRIRKDKVKGGYYAWIKGEGTFATGETPDLARINLIERRQRFDKLIGRNDDETLDFKSSR